jgi:3-deoxy-manno-octulosonate cytidylyltransferase (CMP-KDO synthetase)
MGLTAIARPRWPRRSCAATARRSPRSRPIALAGRVGGTTAVCDSARRALYFSKEVVPFTSRDYALEEETPVFHHVGVYAYRPWALHAYPDWPLGPLEQLEGLEQLRFLEAGHKVLCVEVEARGRKFWELNNPEDIPRIEAMMAEMGME